MKMWLSIEWLYYLFGLGLYEEEIVQDRASRNTGSVNIFQDLSAGIGKIK